MTPSALALLEPDTVEHATARPRTVATTRPALRLVARPSSGHRLEPAELRQLLEALDLRRRRAQIRARHALA